MFCPEAEKNSKTHNFMVIKKQYFWFSVEEKVQLLLSKGLFLHSFVLKKQRTELHTEDLCCSENCTKILKKSKSIKVPP